MKLLIAISSCEEFETNGCNQAMRDTWLKDVGKHYKLDYKFFVGHGPNGHDLHPGYFTHHDGLPNDVVQLDCLDDYGHLTYKTQASLRWAYENDYEFVFRCFPDTYVKLDRLMECGFKSHCYHGDFRGEVTEAYALNYASGGAGYWLSKNAYQHLLDAPILGIWRDELMVYVEDMWVGNILGRARQAGHPILYFDDKRFINKGQNNFPNQGNNQVTAHLSAGGPMKYYPGIMHAAHRVWGK
jgi:hypothetical protein